MGEQPSQTRSSDPSQSTDVPEISAPGRVRRVVDFLLLPWTGVLIALVAVSGCLSVASPYFLSTSNIIGTVAVYFSWICIAGFGEAMVMIGGGLDLSVGSTMGLAGMISALVLSSGLGLPLAALAGLAAGVGVGLANGLVITRIGLNPFITTLGSLSIVRGLTFGVVQGMAVTPPNNASGTLFSALGTGNMFGIPNPVLIMLGLGVVIYVLMTTTPFGRHVYGLGGNEQAARLLGLNVNHLKIKLYVASGVLAAIGGMLLTAKAGTALPDAATGYELKVIAAVIIGGTSLAGGRGTIPGVLIGAALLGVINDGIVLLGMAGYWQQLITGVVIIVAASIDILRRRLERLQIT
ncbi:ABC transporter permease [Acidiphilium sp.]|uniref:ABC transporter permease n=1 Tax=Acidiphilium sp. TaxID=527 RepID=UPI003CFEC71D